MVVRMKKNKKRLLFVLLVLLVLISITIYLGLKSFWPYQYWKFRNMAGECAQSGQICAFEDFFDFKWDVAYSDRGVYSTGNQIKAKYGLEFEVKPGWDEFEAKFLFFYKGRLVKVGRYSKTNLIFPEETEQIFPDTEFEIRYYNGNEYVLEFIQVTGDE